MTSVSGAKLPNEYENPVDIAVIKLASPLTDLAQDTGLEPNDVTLASFVCAVASLYHFYKCNSVAATGFWALNYLCDTIDGLMARRYHMETEFGDLFDHVTDVVSYAGLLTITFQKARVTGRWGVGLVALVAALAAVHHMACQELYVQGKHQKVAMLDSWILPLGEPGTMMKWTRWFGVGTANLIFMWLIWYYCTDRG